MGGLWADYETHAHNTYRTDIPYTFSPKQREAGSQDSLSPALGRRVVHARRLPLDYAHYMLHMRHTNALLLLLQSK